MRALSAILICLIATAARADPPANPVPWVQLTEIYYTPSQVRLYGSGDDPNRNCLTVICNAIYVQTHLSGEGVNFGQQSPNTPTTVDLTGPPYNLPSDAKAAFLTGMLIITHGTTSETADIHLTAGAYGDNAFDCAFYLGQTIEASVGNGQRSNAAFWVPLTNGKFKFCYSLSTSGQWPTNSSYGINFSLQMWGR
jgi:hypothetical protein